MAVASSYITRRGPKYRKLVAYVDEPYPGGQGVLDESSAQLTSILEMPMLTTIVRLFGRTTMLTITVL